MSHQNPGPNHVFESEQLHLSQPSQTYHNQHQWVIIDESSSIASPNQRSNRPSPPVPVIKVPFPPMVNPEELITRPRKVKSKLPTKPPNAFMIYRMQYVKELHARDHRLPMRSVSSAVASSWREEPEHIVEHYEEIAREASRIYNQKFPKPPTPQKGPVARHSRRRTINIQSGIPMTHIDNSPRPHFHSLHRFYPSDHHSHRSSLSTIVHGHHNYHMHSSNPQNQAIPSMMESHYSSNLLGRPSMRPLRSLSTPYSPTTNHSSTTSPFHMPSLPHVHSFHYMDDAANNTSEWDFAASAHA
ncbi:21521_t:CDS:1 [Gigaspora margarita]|uniref:21521_t:CDS:1 n=2 Tax=Gigaspora margarita TaxID=4874 RepID=A0ABN7UEK6_GIGMA|nr:mating type protein mat1-2-1 [Gigaspora margarita]CAG8563499.1 21521_t:CDS:1 [Gigaspora margarita]